MFFLFTAAFLLIYSATAYKSIVEDQQNFYDFGELEDFSYDIVEIGLEDFASVKGVRHANCSEKRQDCKDFITCTTRCESKLIDIKDLEPATFAVREEDKIEGKTNPCVAMYAFCIPAPYRVLKKALNLNRPEDY